MSSGATNPITGLQQQQLLLRMEYEYEKEEFRRQTETEGIARKIKRGLCWYPVKAGTGYYNSLNRFVVEIKREEKEEDTETEHFFEYGRPVCFFSQSDDGKLTYLDFTASISYVRDDLMVVALPGAGVLPHLLLPKNNLGVQLYFDETTYRFMFEALEDVISAKGNRLATLRDTLLGTLKPESRTLYPVNMPWLNGTQERAVNRILCSRDTAVVHGPPGTGKTTTLVEAIYETLRREPQVLVCAQSNMAVDWISEKLVDRGINVLRIGNPSRVNDKMLSFTYERLFESHPDYPELWSVRKLIRSNKSSGQQKTQKQLRRLYERAVQLEIQINTYLFNSAKVIASTLAGSNQKALNGRRFSTLFIDEAAQALEAACWIAIRKADRVVFAGDHCQLSPTIKCIDAARGGLEHTLMEKVVHQKPETVSLLEIQYRMNETIMRFSSEWFYNGKLKAAPEVRHRGILDFDRPMVWIDTSEMDFHEKLAGNSLSRINRKEACLLLEKLEAYILKIGRKRILDEHIDFGLISPYKAQVHYLRNKIKNSDAFRDVCHVISVNTVDGFQGQER
ncbi:MAG: AAA family ATPase, partial [Tannerella sp.]|nr:AAA family ATPase [Tannerella sp.]